MCNIIDFIKQEKIKYSENQSMKKHTTFKIGGEATLFIMPSTIEEVSKIVKFLFENQIDYFVLGNGSNLLVSDEGIKKPVIKTDFLDFIQLENTCIFAGSGCLNSKVANYALSNSLSGLEFCHGIPGSIGGAVFMNAGAYGEDFSGVCIKTVYVDRQGQIKTSEGPEQGFGYRKSSFTNGEIICAAYLSLKHGISSEIKAKMEDLMSRRKSTQPLEYPSAGSVFKRPEGYYTGKLIDDCGLKGFTIGGAQVSEKHSGFIINKGNATEQDVSALIEHIKNTVYEKFGVQLQTEIRKI